MSKLKHSICPKCSKMIGRHDAARVSVKVARGSRGQGVYKCYHLRCYQSSI